jgi:ribosomal protein S12 methylthiotransferase accessory factor
MVWLTQRVSTPFQIFQTSSNGLATGFNRRDAELSALYELVERDAWAISDFKRERTGQWPDLISLQCRLSPELALILERLSEANVYPFVFDLSVIGVPVFSAILLDPSDSSPGVFAGYGASLNSSVAVRRALSEAAQARAGYISGARDDLFRRRFIILKKVNHQRLLELYQLIRPARVLEDCPHLDFPTLQDEWETLIERLVSRGISEIYSRELYSFGDLFSVARVLAPQLEPPIWDHWVPGRRALSALESFS